MRSLYREAAGGRVLSVSSVLFVVKESRPRMTPISRIERHGEKIWFGITAGSVARSLFGATRDGKCGMALRSAACDQRSLSGVTKSATNWAHFRRRLLCVSARHNRQGW